MRIAYRLDAIGRTVLMLVQSNWLR